MIACIKPLGDVATALARFVNDGAVELEHWDEDKTKFKPLLFLHADTYFVDPLFDIPPSTVTEPIYVRSPGKRFAYSNRILSAGMP
jgi:hypothetical protein